MIRLELSLLGPPQIRLEKSDVKGFNTRKDRALLIYLAVSGTRHSREALTGLLWPEMPDDKARRNLRTSLSNLRKLIGPEWFDTQDGISLVQRDQLWIDAIELQAIAESDEEVKVAQYQEVLHLYSGEFLQGFQVRKAPAFEEWALMQQEQYRMLALRSLTALVRSYLETNDVSQGLVTSERLLQIEPWHEEGHRMRMAFLNQNGQQTEALRQYDSCRRILDDTFGVAPEQETVALFEKIKRDRTDSNLDPDASAESIEQREAGAATPNATADNRPVIPNNLVTPLAAFVGRQTEVDFIRERLATPDCRLLTIVGPGGMGKSSLAQAMGWDLLDAAAPDFEEGIFWVPLADINAADQAHAEQDLADEATVGEAIQRAIAEVLSMTPEIKLSSIQQLHAYLRTRRILLILDNFEHLLEGAHTLVTLLAQSPHIKLLVTSRARLNIRSEHILALDKLSLPSFPNQTDAQTLHADSIYCAEDSSWQESEAVAMFVQRGQQLDPDFVIDSETIGPVVQICHSVGGLPLGIELATSMLPLLSGHELATELTVGLDFLESDALDLPDDQRTLAAVFERSWQLLSPEAQQLLTKLAIFPASFQRDAATAIAGASLSTLKPLIDQSLVSKGGKNRYILHRTIHAFAWQKLQQRPELVTTLRIQYAHFYLLFLADLEEAITGAAYGTAREQIQNELDNIRTAWRRALAQRMYGEIYNCLTTLFIFYEQHGFNLDAFALYESAVSHFQSSNNKEPSHRNLGTEQIELFGLLQTYFAWFNMRVGRLQQVQAIYESSWSILKETGSHRATAIYLMFVGAWERVTNLQRSTELLTESLRLSQASGLKWLEVLVHLILAENSALSGRYDEAEAKINAASTLAEQMQWMRSITSGYKILARINLLRGRYAQAEEGLRTAITLARQHHFDIFYIECTIMLAEALRLQGRLNEAKPHFVECQKRAEELNAADMFAAPLFWEEGCLAEQHGSYAEAKVLFTQSLELGLPNWWSHALPTLGWALIGLGELDEARSYFQQILAQAEAQKRLPIMLDAQAGLASVAILKTGEGQLDGAKQSKIAGESVSCFQYIYRHSSATQQTRNRIERLAVKWALALTETSAS